MVCCGHRVGVLLVVGEGDGWATHVVYCAKSQITGSPPLLSDLDILCEMEHEGPWVRFPAGLRCVFSSDPAVSSSIFVGAVREELIRNDPDKYDYKHNNHSLLYIGSTIIIF